LKRIQLAEFVVVGERWDLDLEHCWDFGRSDWEDRLRGEVVVRGTLHHTFGSDYFVFPRGSPISELPEFAVGRPGWDNWFIFRARNLGIPVVDVTRAVTVIHQNHDYKHVPERRGGQWEGPEGDMNIGLAGDAYYYQFRPADATHVMTSRGLSPALGFKYLRRRLGTLPVLVPSTRPLFQSLDVLKRALRSLLKIIV
jgi:hypothetical protein